VALFRQRQTRKMRRARARHDARSVVDARSRRRNLQHPGIRRGNEERGGVGVRRVAGGGVSIALVIKHRELDELDLCLPEIFGS